LAAVDADRGREPPDVRQQYFGTRVQPRTFAQWLDDITGILASGQRRWLSAHHNLHSLYLLQRNDDVNRFYARCNDCYVDGTPVRLLLKGFGIPTNAAQRFSLMDHFLDLLRHAEQQQWSIFYLGSQESVVQSGRALVSRMFPALRMHLQHGYGTDPGQVVNTINAVRPDILLVGMGMPLQERWLLEHLDQLDIGFATQAGGTLDYYTGAQARPPRWIGRIGLAWSYRLLGNPRRLWRRYLLEPWALLQPTVRHWRRYRHAVRCAHE
jgi:N-acetylglucosaminyldiphosphoundecaprenol N-acetyl-beta-D-mannosaminyltransferase